jgi:exopolysaccharide biosynthesis protein
MFLEGFMDVLNYFYIFVISFLTISTICAIISVCLSIKALIMVQAMKESTHNLEYVPIDPKWASSDKEISEFNEKSESELPDIDDDELNPADIDFNKMI